MINDTLETKALQPTEVALWKSSANCAGIDTELYFLEQGQTATQMPILKRICDACPVQQECLDYAIKYHMVGYWANTTTKQRSKIRGKK